MCFVICYKHSSLQESDTQIPGPSKHHPQQEASPPPPRRHLTAPPRWPRPSPTKWRLQAPGPAPSQPSSHSLSLASYLGHRGSRRHSRQQAPQNREDKQGRFRATREWEEERVVVLGITGSKQARREGITRRSRGTEKGPWYLARFLLRLTIHARESKPKQTKLATRKRIKPNWLRRAPTTKWSWQPQRQDSTRKHWWRGERVPQQGGVGGAGTQGWKETSGGCRVRRRQVGSPKTESGGGEVGHGCRVGHVGNCLGLRKQCKYPGKESRTC